MSTSATIERIRKEIADLQKKISLEKKKEADAISKENHISKSINKNTSSATLQSKLRQIERCRNDAAKASKNQANLHKKLAAKSSELHRYEQRLKKEQESIRKKFEEEMKQREHELAVTQQALVRELENQKQFIHGLTSSATQTNLDYEESQIEYDVFISHASEDKEDFVRSLAEELMRIGVRVWYDEFSLKWGDSLRRSIDKGLAKSRFGVVVLSPSFFEKRWTQYELDGLVAREMYGGKVILPIWHRVTKDEVMNFSPSLADKLAMNTSIDEISKIAKQLKDLL